MESAHIDAVQEAKPPVLPMSRRVVVPVLLGAMGNKLLEDLRLERSFAVWWPELERQLNEIQAMPLSSSAELPAEPSPNEALSRVLEEVLELTRNNHKLLRSPEAILPPDYIAHVLRRLRGDEVTFEVRGFEGQIDPGALKETIELYRDVLKFIGISKSDLEPHPAYSELLSLLRRLDDPLRYIARQMSLRLPREPLATKDEF